MYPYALFILDIFTFVRYFVTYHFTKQYNKIEA